MMTQRRTKSRALAPVLAGALALGLAGAGLAHAATGGEANHEDAADAAVIAGARISLGQAIGLAERQTGGRAFDAGGDNENGTARISVEVATAQGMRTVLIDPRTGAVTATRAGGEAGDGDGEHAD